MFEPKIFKIPKTDNSQSNGFISSSNVIPSATINYQLISLGFQTYMHKTKDTLLAITSGLKTQNKFYYVVNEFEHEISNYKDSLDESTIKYLNLKELPQGVRPYYKIWEMLYGFSLIPSVDFSYMGISLNPQIINFSVESFKNKLVNEKSKTKSFDIKINGNGKPLQFIEHIKKATHTCDLVIADGSYDVFSNESSPSYNFQEQESYSLLLGQVALGLKTQNKNGSMIIKLFESYTLPTIKIVYLLSYFYEELYIYKPYMSRTSNPEKYIICKNFNPNKNIVLQKLINNIENIITESSKNFIFDIFPSVKIPQEYLKLFRYVNIKLANELQIVANDIIVYIKENNYFGDKYHTYRNKQISASNWWRTTFYPPSNNLYKEQTLEIQKLYKQYYEKHLLEENNLSDKLS